MKLGILAVQGAVHAHRRVLDAMEVATVEVRTPAHLEDVDALVLPGGESTTMSRLVGTSSLGQPLADRLADGLPALGTCAGMILLAATVLDGRADQVSFGAIDVAVRRNGYGRQLDSFESEVAVTGLDRPFPAAFIRAPVVDQVGPGVEVLATLEDRPVLCRQGPVWVSTFHPELSGDGRIHEQFLAEVT